MERAESAIPLMPWFRVNHEIQRFFCGVGLGSVWERIGPEKAEGLNRPALQFRADGRAVARNPG